MSLFKRHANIDYRSYNPSSNTREAKYGLPEDVHFCRQCVISNQRPSSTPEFSHTKESRKRVIRFDAEGVCDACRVQEEKQKIDWAEREKQLHELAARFRRSDGRHDCIVAGSGGKDSFYASHLLKYKYGLNPLTVTWAPHIYTDWGWRNFQAWIHAGFDNVLYTPNGRVQRLLTRLALENLLHPFQPFILGQKNYPPKVALQLGIPLVFYGENEAEYGNPREDNSSAKRDWQYFTSGDASRIHLGGQSLRELYSVFGLQPSDLNAYMPADPNAVQDLKLEVHYVGYYERWHPQSCYYYAVENSNFQAAPERTAGTYSKYNGIDDKLDDLHYYTTWIKFGIGRATYDAAQEIRNGDIDREEGRMLVRRYDGEFPERFIDELLAYLSLPEKEFPLAAKTFEQPIMDRAYFDHLCDRFRSPHLWRYEEGTWNLLRTVWSEER